VNDAGQPRIRIEAAHQSHIRLGREQFAPRREMGVRATYKSYAYAFARHKCLQ
jgi:hypothetical protein